MTSHVGKMAKKGMEMKGLLCASSLMHIKHSFYSRILILIQEKMF
jgi:hypothetical protein